MFEKLYEFGWKPIFEGKHVIALKKNDKNITLEPGNQIELSGAKLNNIHETCGESHEYLFELKQVIEKLDLKGKKRDDYFHYDYISCPTIFPGQKISLEIENIFSHEISITLFSKYWGENDKLQKISSNIFNLSGNQKKLISWVLPDTESNPIGQIGFNISSEEKKEGQVILNYVNFEGEPKQIFFML